MKKSNKKIKKLLPFFSLLPLVVVSTPIISSCSSNKLNQNVDQEFIDKQFQNFQNSLILDSVYDNLYFENFNFANENTIELSQEEINKFISLNPISNFFSKTRFEVSKNLEENSIEIKMILMDETEKKYSPSRPSDSYKTIQKVKSLNEQEKNIVENISLMWRSFVSNNLSIINENDEVLEKSKYQNVLPSYLSISNFNLEMFDNLVDINRINKEWKINYTFTPNNEDGKINLSFSISNKITNLEFYFNQNNSVEILGFATQENRDKEVMELFNQIGNSYNVSEIIKTKDMPYFPSSIYNIEQLEIFLKDIKANYDNFVIPNYFDASVEERNNLWYELNISMTANDTTGILSITFTIIDKFTKTPIIPENLVKIMTFSGMLSLGKKLNDSSDIDNSSVENVYRAYRLFKEIKIKNGYNKLPENLNFDATVIDYNWLKTNTNINEIIETINDQGEFEIKSPIYKFDNENTDDEILNDLELEKTNIFRIKSINNEKIIKNNVSGIIEFPIILEVKWKIKNNETEEEKWITVLPPKTKTGEGANAEYSAATNESYIQIGGYRNNDIDFASQIYYYFLEPKNQEIIIKIDNQSYFKELMKEVKNQKQILEVLSDEISLEFQKIVNNVFNDDIKTENFLSKFTYFFDLSSIPLIWNDNLNSFKTNDVEFRIVSKSNSDYYLDYYPNNSSTIEDFPTIHLTVTCE